jgi:hypothetical protein
MAVTVSLVAADAPNTASGVTGISADVRYVAYLVGAAGTDRLVVADLQTGTVTQITSADPPANNEVIIADAINGDLNQPPQLYVVPEKGRTDGCDLL